MTDSSIKPIRTYPSLPEPGQDSAAHANLLRLIKEGIQIHERRTGNWRDSFVRVGELVDLGVIKVNGDRISIGDEVGGSGESTPGVTDHGALTGLGDDDHPQYLLVADYTPGLSEHSVHTRGATWVRANNPIEVPVNYVPLFFPRAATILGVTVLTLGGPGDCEIDIWKRAFASYPPDMYDSIVGGSPPLISSGVTYRDTTLSGWDVDIDAGDTMLFNLMSTDVFELIHVVLDIQETP